MIEIQDRAFTFANNFWGPDDAGYDVLTARVVQAKRTCDEVRSMFTARAQLEEDYGKKLLKIARAPLGKEETGTLRSAFDSVKRELESTAQSHLTLSKTILTQLDKPISEFITHQKEARSKTERVVDKARQSKLRHMQWVAKSKERYEKEAQNVVALRGSVSAMNGRDTDRFKTKLEKSESTLRTSDNEYRAAVAMLTDLVRAWNIEWRTACDKYQLLEEERIEHLRNSMWNYANILNAVCVAEDESCERVRVSLEGCEVETDMKIFIKEQRTGPEIPKAMGYVNYFAKRNEGEGDEIQIANFPPPTGSNLSFNSSSAASSADTSSKGRRPTSPAPSRYSIDSGFSSDESHNTLNNPNTRTVIAARVPLKNQKIPPPSASSRFVREEDDVSKILDRRASLYSSTDRKRSGSTTSLVKKDELPSIPLNDDDEAVDAPIRPSAKVVLNIGGNMLEVDPKAEKKSDQSIPQQQHRARAGSASTSPHASALEDLLTKFERDSEQPRVSNLSTAPLQPIPPLTTTISTTSSTTQRRMSLPAQQRPPIPSTNNLARVPTSGSQARNSAMAVSKSPNSSITRSIPPSASNNNIGGIGMSRSASLGGSFDALSVPGQTQSYHSQQQQQQQQQQPDFIPRSSSPALHVLQNQQGTSDMQVSSSMPGTFVNHSPQQLHNLGHDMDTLTSQRRPASYHASPNPSPYMSAMQPPAAQQQQHQQHQHQHQYQHQHQHQHQHQQHQQPQEQQQHQQHQLHHRQSFADFGSTRAVSPSPQAFQQAPMQPQIQQSMSPSPLAFHQPPPTQSQIMRSASPSPYGHQQQPSQQSIPPSSSQNTYHQPSHHQPSHHQRTRSGPAQYYSGTNLAPHLRQQPYQPQSVHLSHENLAQPKILFWSRAQHDYIAQISTEVSFVKNELFAVYRTQPDMWFYGEIWDEGFNGVGGGPTGRKGLFPSNFCVAAGAGEMDDGSGFI